MTEAAARGSGAPINHSRSHRTPATRHSVRMEAVRDQSTDASRLLRRRAAARLVDSAVGLLLLSGVVVLVGAVSGPSADGTGVMLVALVAAFIFYWANEVVCVAAWGGTLGKRLMGVTVVSSSGSQVGWGRSFLRSALPMLLLGGFWPLYPVLFALVVFDRSHRGLHDRLARTLVVARTAT